VVHVSALFRYRLIPTGPRFRHSSDCYVEAESQSEAQRLASERYGDRNWMVRDARPVENSVGEPITGTAELLKAHAEIETEDYIPEMVDVLRASDVKVMQRDDLVTQYDLEWIALNTRHVQEYCRNRGLEVKIIVNHKVRVGS